MKADICYCRALLEHKRGGSIAAERAYRDYLSTRTSKRLGHIINSTEYLMLTERYEDAADHYQLLHRYMQESAFETDLENIGRYLFPKYRANLFAGRKDSALSVASQIAEAYDSALVRQKRTDAILLSTIYETDAKERQLAEQQAQHLQYCLYGVIAVLLLIIVFLAIYGYRSNKHTQRMKTVNSKLQQTYDQLEETTKAKERIESELRIAREIQRRMLPHVFPRRRDIDIYAMMTPAKEVGGDLYAYALIDDLLYFCVGDVSGKGVPAALFMAEVTRMFRTLVDGRLQPNVIATRLNHALAEDNEQGMFVTMFIGLINLKTGHMEYCNAGHNPPLLDGEFMEMEPNAPIGLWPELDYEGETINDMHGKTLFVYTDGINEAENIHKEQFGDERLQALLKQDLGDARQTSETIHRAVEEFVGDAEPSDDLTKMCIKMHN
jgi:serine phosphatase RsbU (regulator of sigma subunit)